MIDSDLDDYIVTFTERPNNDGEMVVDSQDELSEVVPPTPATSEHVAVSSQAASVAQYRSATSPPMSHQPTSQTSLSPAALQPMPPPQPASDAAPRQSWGNWLVSSTVGAASYVWSAVTGSSSNTNNNAQQQQHSAGQPPGDGAAGTSASTGAIRRSNEPINESMSSNNDPFAPEGSHEGTGRSMSDDGGGIVIPLRIAIRQFLEYSDELTFKIAAAAVGQCGAITEEDWDSAQGNIRLLTLFLESGRLDLQVTRFHSRIRQAIADIIPEDPKVLVRARYIPVVKALLRIKISRITWQQERVLNCSGVQFQQIVQDNPHVLLDVESPGFFTRYTFEKFIRALRPLFLVMGMTGIAISIASAVILAFEERDNELDENFSATIVYIVGSSGAGFVLVRIMHRRQLHQVATYGADIADFPSVYLKLFPSFFEGAVCLVALKHIVLHRSRNVALSHDLCAMFSLLFLLHAYLFSMPMNLLQLYMLEWTSSNREAVRGAVVDSVLFSNFVLIICTFPLYITLIVLNDNTTFFGFVVNAHERDAGGRTPSAFSRILAFILLYFFVYNVFFLIIGVLNISECDTTTAIWLVVGGVVTTITMIFFVISVQRNNVNVFRAARWFFLPLIIQFVWFILGQLYTTKDKEECELFYEIGVVSLLFNYVGWGITFSVIIVFALYKLYRRCNRTNAVGDGSGAEGADLNHSQMATSSLVGVEATGGGGGAGSGGTSPQSDGGDTTVDEEYDDEDEEEYDDDDEDEDDEDEESGERDDQLSPQSAV